MDSIPRKILKFLDTRGIKYETRGHDPVVTIEDVERVLKISPHAMGKALVMKADKEVIIAVVCGDNKLSRLKLAKELGIQRKNLDFLPREKIRELTGLEPGSIPLFGLKYPVIMDVALASQDKIYCGMGSLTLSLRVCPKDIIQQSENIRTGNIST